MARAFRPRPAKTTFNFPFRVKTMGTGSYNAPPSSRPSKSMPPIKQFSRLSPGPRRKPKG